MTLKRTRQSTKLSTQVRRRAYRSKQPVREYDGDIDTIISTGSTLLDLAISGGRIPGGGLPGGILVEIHGPPSCGKTVLLCEIAGAVQRQGGQIMFHDPEARLNKVFARLFGLDTKNMEYGMPDTVPEVFIPVRKWKPEPEGVVHGVFADSLAALSTDMEMEDKDGMGMRRAKEFSEELRKTCRILTRENFLMVCSNQVRQSVGAGTYGPKHSTPGGKAPEHYSSLRLQCYAPKKMKRKKTIAGREQMRIIGVEIEVYVQKSSIWNPYRTAPITILFDYGIDDIRENLQAVKEWTGRSYYSVKGEKIARSLDKAIVRVEQQGLEKRLRREVIKLWSKVEAAFKQERKPKR